MVTTVNFDTMIKDKVLGNFYAKYEFPNMFKMSTNFDSQYAATSQHNTEEI